MEVTWLGTGTTITREFYAALPLQKGRSLQDSSRSNRGLRDSKELRRLSDCWCGLQDRSRGVGDCCRLCTFPANIVVQRPRCISIARMRLSLLTLYAFCALATLCGHAHGSAGDRLQEFRECVSECVATTCANEDSAQLPGYLTLFFWDCPQNCDYNCQRSITAERVKRGAKVLQFHGKWPFQRVLGIQEPASVIFSIMNFVPQYRAYTRLAPRLPQDDARKNFYLRKYYVAVMVAGMNAWVWSSVFHCRDFKLTERLDYFSAGITVMTGFYFTMVRVFRLDRREKTGVRGLLTVACVLATAAHIGYLSFIRFSYTYNMAANIVLGIAQNIVMSGFSIHRYVTATAGQRAGWMLWPFYHVLLLSAAMSLEVFDFPPAWDAIDAHSLWHASTAGITVWYYRWVALDAAHEARAEHRD
ncbi:Per1-like-domain-containing protein [Limtongia smithiae]|uniref:Per1-like-domain-containing protein n=1 Tax=Limtongia smithiae TaxID=1125753 RepID=UPI0034CDAD1A